MSTNTNTQTNCNLNKFDPDLMNQHFCEVGPKLNAAAPTYSNISFKDFLPERDSDCSFTEFYEVSKDSVESYVKSLEKGKAVFDEIPLKIFKCIFPAILEPLTHIVNLSLKTGQIPELCKYAQVTPISKGGDTSDMNDYRPISILPVITKCIEFFVNDQLTRYFEENNLYTYKSPIWI